MDLEDAWFKKKYTNSVKGVLFILSEKIFTYRSVLSANSNDTVYTAVIFEVSIDCLMKEAHSNSVS